MTVNLNKLFPRLSIRHKLAIALAGVALVPLAIVSTFGAAWSARQIEAAARATIENDLRLAETLTARELAESERHIELLARGLAARLDRSGGGAGGADQLDAAMTELVAMEPALYRIKLIDADRRELLAITASGVERVRDDLGRGTLYAWRAEQLPPGARMLMPVELPSTDEDTAATVPALAILVPMFDGDSAFAGVVVGEALAARLFAGLDAATPGLGGVTALIDADGHFLYHSVRKRDWAVLLANRERVGVETDLSPVVVAAIQRDSVGALRAPDASLVSFRRLNLGSIPFESPLSLYRVVDASSLTAPVSRFLRWVLAWGLVVVVGVVGVAFIAGEQLTRPIRRIQDAMWRLARGDSPTLPEVATNDEIEDLARDFREVADVITSSRAKQEALLTDRTRALAVTHAELTGIVGHSADAIIGTDQRGRIRLWNEAAARLFGFAADDVVGRELATVWSGIPGAPPEDQRFIDAELARSGSVTDFRTTRHGKDGAPIPVSLSHACVRDGTGSVVGYSVIARDRRAQELLDIQMRRSERLAAMSVVAASVAHELNNPLAVAATRVELMQRDMQRGVQPEQLANDLGVVREHLQRASGVTRDVLRFAREGPDAAEATDLGVMVERHCALLKRTMAVRGLQLDHAIAPGLSTITVNQKAVEAVLLNLLLNAADATPSGGSIRVTLAPGSRPNSIELSVEDSGPGIPPELRERIFEPFFTTKTGSQGTGLGLTVSRTIMQRLGGDISVRQSQLGGAAFVLRFPTGSKEEVA